MDREHHPPRQNPPQSASRQEPPNGRFSEGSPHALHLDERIGAYLDNELNAVERVEVEQLLATNAQARQLLEELQSLRTGLRALPQYKIAHASAQAPHDMLAAILRRAERESLAPGRNSQTAIDTAPLTVTAAQTSHPDEQPPSAKSASAHLRLTVPASSSAKRRWLFATAWTGVGAAAAVLAMALLYPGNGWHSRPDIAQLDSQELVAPDRATENRAPQDSSVSSAPAEESPQAGPTTADGIESSEDRALQRDGVNRKLIASDLAKEFRNDGGELDVDLPKSRTGVESQNRSQADERADSRRRMNPDGARDPSGETTARQLNRPRADFEQSVPRAHFEEETEQGGKGLAEKNKGLTEKKSTGSVQAPDDKADAGIPIAPAKRQMPVAGDRIVIVCEISPETLNGRLFDDVLAMHGIRVADASPQIAASLANAASDRKAEDQQNASPKADGESAKGEARGAAAKVAEGKAAAREREEEIATLDTVFVEASPAQIEKTLASLAANPTVFRQLREGSLDATHFSNWPIAGTTRGRMLANASTAGPDAGGAGGPSGAGTKQVSAESLQRKSESLEQKPIANADRDLLKDSGNAKVVGNVDPQKPIEGKAADKIAGSKPGDRLADGKPDAKAPASPADAKIAGSNIAGSKPVPSPGGVGGGVPAEHKSQRSPTAQAMARRANAIDKQPKTDLDPNNRNESKPSNNGSEPNPPAPVSRPIVSNPPVAAKAAASAGYALRAAVLPSKLAELAQATEGVHPERRHLQEAAAQQVAPRPASEPALKADKSSVTSPPAAKPQDPKPQLPLPQDSKQGEALAKFAAPPAPSSVRAVFIFRVKAK